MKNHREACQVKSRNFAPLTIGIVICILSIFIPILLRHGFNLVINYTDSLPKGIYHLKPVCKLTTDKIVALAVPEHVRELVYGRGWLLRNGFLINVN